MLTTIFATYFNIRDILQRPHSDRVLAIPRSAQTVKLGSLPSLGTIQVTFLVPFVGTRYAIGSSRIIPRSASLISMTIRGRIINVVRNSNSNLILADCPMHKSHEDRDATRPEGRAGESHVEVLRSRQVRIETFQK